MAEVTAIFWDLGGAVLTNGWGRADRRRAAEHFHLDWEDFQDRHDMVTSDFETGRMTLEEYLKQTVFYRPRPFGEDQFRSFMFEQSQGQPETMGIVKGLARSGKYLMATLNNESMELNLHRIEKFQLRDYFAAFFSSCFLGVKKPERPIYRLASQITQRNPEECLFIDDRVLNLECAQTLGMRTIHFRNATQLRQELQTHGVKVEQPTE